ncbi:MAG: RlpA-like double-psi beta-barrel domain-containing protein [Polyangiales bacterium]
MTSRRSCLFFAVMLARCAPASSPAPNDGASSANDAASSTPMPFGEEHVGEYHLGPVEWTGSFNNACSPYPAPVQQIEGAMLAGLSNEVAANGSFCDACITITTDQGRSVTARVVTYGVTQAPGNIDVSQAAFNVLHANEPVRRMRWRLTRCPGNDPIHLQFQTGANPWWTSLWVRAPSVAVERVEVRSANHSSWFAMRRGGDGTFNDDGGFGEGPFTLRITGKNGATVEVARPGFTAGELVRTEVNLP